MKTATIIITTLLSSGTVEEMAPEYTPVPKKAPIVREGSCGAEAKKVSQKLLDLGFLAQRKNSSRCIDYTTSMAIYAFQKYKGLAADGVVGPKTRRVMKKTNRVLLEKIPGYKKSYGKNYILVSLKKQLLVVVKKRKPESIVSISSGKAGFSTPTGIFSVFRKEEMSWSNPYSVWMPWASYFNGGIAMHESDSVPPYPASHGCVRIPAGFSKYIYHKAPYGKKIVVV